MIFLFSLLAVDLVFQSPQPGVFAGRTTVQLTTDASVDDIIGLELFVNGESVFYFEEAPYEYELDFSHYASGALELKAVLSLFGKEDVETTLKGENIPHFESQSVNLVRIPVMFLKQPGKRMQISDFKLLEENKPQKIELLFDETKPISLTVLMDLSGSMENFVLGLRKGVFTLIDSLRPDDKIHIIGFDHRVFEISPPTTDHKAAKRALYSVQSRGATNLYGAIWAGVKSLREEPQRRALVVFTDGEHDLDGMEDPYQKTVEDCIAEAKQFGIPIFAMGLGAGVRPEILQQLGDETGGAHYRIRRIRNLEQAFKDIGEALRRQYVLGYYSQSTRYGWHEVGIHVEGSELRYPKRLYIRER